MIQKLTPPLTICLFCVLGFLLYANSLSTPFQFDDTDYITDNASIREGLDPDTLLESRWSKGRFLVFWTFAANYALNGLDPVGYHVVNVLIHILAALAVWWLMRLILDAPVPNVAAVFAALLFLCHPIQTESVTYISQRFTSLCTLFYILSMCFYICARRGESAPPWMLYTASAICAVGAMFSKEIAITLPLNILLVEYYFLGGGAAPRPRIVPILFFLLIIPAMYGFNVANILTIEHASGSHEGDYLTSLTYFMTQARVLVRYLALLFFPIGQNILHDVPMSRSLIDPPTTLLSFLALGALLVGAIKLRHKNKFVGYGIVWFFLCLSVESSFITIRHVMFEHRLYLPSIGIFMAVTAIIFGVGARSPRPPRKGGETPPLRGLIMMSVIIILSILTVQRNQIWRTPLTLWQDAHEKSPGLIKPLAHIGLAHLAERDFGAALAAFNEALKINPRHAYIYYNRAITHHTMGYWQKALEDYSKTIEIAPDYLRAYYNRGNIYGKHDYFEEALRDFTTVIERDPGHVAALNNRGIIYLKLDRPQEALADYDRILRRKPDSLMALIHRGNTYRTLKEYDHALRDYAAALQVEPKAAKVYWLRASLYKELGRAQEAAADERKLMELTKGSSRNFHRSGDPNNEFVDLLP